MLASAAVTPLSNDARIANFDCDRTPGLEGSPEEEGFRMTASVRKESHLLQTSLLRTRETTHQSQFFPRSPRNHRESGKRSLGSANLLAPGAVLTWEHGANEMVRPLNQGLCSFFVQGPYSYVVQLSSAAWELWSRFWLGTLMGQNLKPSQQLGQARLPFRARARKLGLVEVCKGK